MHIDKFTKAIDEFNNELFFECHDTLEEIWNEEKNPKDKKFYHGLIHVTVGFYHLTNLNPRGAVSQLKKAIDKLDGFPKLYKNIDLHNLISEVKSWLEKAELTLNGNQQDLNFTKFPKIKFVVKDEDRQI